MAKNLAQFVADIRGYLQKGKLKAARKALDKAQKVGHKGPQFKEITLELLLAEEGGQAAAVALRDLAQTAPARLSAAIKTVESHLRQQKTDHVLRDSLWELCLSLEQYEIAIKHADFLLKAGAFDPAARAQQLLARKDAVGATGIFLLASLGAVKTDRVKLAHRLLGNDLGARLLYGVADVLHSRGNEDSEIHYVLAQVAKKRGDKDTFLLHASKAFDEDPAGVWTHTMGDQSSTDRLEFALAKDSVKYLLEAAKEAKPDELIAAAERSKGEGTAARLVRGLGLLLNKKPPNACRILEKALADDPEAADAIADFLFSKSQDWAGARQVYAAVVASSLAGSEQRVTSAIDGLLKIKEDRREEAWFRSAPKLLEKAAARDDLRSAVGLYFMAHDDQEAAAALLTEKSHLEIVKAWAKAGGAKGPVLLGAATLAEEHDVVPDHAEWLLTAAKGDAETMAELGVRLSGSAVSADTALQGAAALIGQNQKKEAADLLARLSLDTETGGKIDKLLKDNRLADDRAFNNVSFRCALALGDSNRARRLFSTVQGNVQVLAKEAARFRDSGRVLAEVLIAQNKGEIGVELLDARREAGDDARSLLPLADALLKTSSKLSMGRLVRAKLLRSLQRETDAVRDLRAIPMDAAQLDEAFTILGELAEGESGAAAVLGRADIHIGRKMYADAVKELNKCKAPAPDRLQRYEAVCRQHPDMDSGHKGRAECLLELNRIPEAADSQLKRFSCSDADRAAVASDLEDVAAAALKTDDIQTGCTILEQLPEQVSDGAERAITVIGEDQRAPMLILRSKLLLQLGRTEEAVTTLADLVSADPPSRPQAAQALEAIVESGQARPEADFALADAYEAQSLAPQALGALARLYDDDITSKDNVVKGAEKLVVKADDPDVRLFLGRVCLDMRDPRGATENAIHARRLRPAARRDCVKLLQRALDQDAFAPETHFAVAEAHLAGDEADDAVRHFRAAVEVDKGRATASIGAMEEAAPRSKSPALLWLAVGTTYAEFLRKHEAAVTAYTNGLEANPTTEMRVPLLLGRGDSYAALREDDKAFDDFDEASGFDLLERRYYEFLRARHRQRVLEAAETAQAKAHKSFAHAAEACGRFIRLGRPEDAVNVAQQALTVAPQDVGPRYLVGVALHAARRYDAAAQVLEAVRSSAPADSDVGRACRMLLAESYLDNGDRVRARNCLTEIEAVDAAYPGLNARRAALAPPADDPHAPPPLFVRPEFPRPTE